MSGGGGRSYHSSSSRLAVLSIGIARIITIVILASFPVFSLGYHCAAFRPAATCCARYSTRFGYYRLVALNNSNSNSNNWLNYPPITSSRIIDTRMPRRTTISSRKIASSASGAMESSSALAGAATVTTSEDDDTATTATGTSGAATATAAGGSKNIQLDDVDFLRQWVSHSDKSFHSLDDATATEIREALLVWYRQHRRKLPWRGDPPPYDGSTAGINNNNNNNKHVATPKKPTAKQKQDTASSVQSNKITNFFLPTSTTNSNSTTTSTTATRSSNKRNSKSATDRKELASSTAAPSTELPPDPILSSLSSTSTSIPAAVSAYGVWVSEIMLQQTRVEAVIPYWIRWMTSFPTVHDLAAATDEQVNAHWAGLGFYRRARLLHQGAQRVVKEYNGELPGTVDELLQITGIGPYTASAIASIAFNVCVPVVDGNVCRVLSRLTGIANHIKAPALKDKHGWELAAQLVQAGDGTSAGEVNQALMELGATYCAPSGTGIDPRDPLKDYYYSTRLAKAYSELLQQPNGHGTLSSELSVVAESSSSCACSLCDASGIRVVLEQLEERIPVEMALEDAMKEGHGIFPLDPPKTKRREEDLAVAVLSNIDDDGQVWWLLVRRPAKGLLAGQWEFPSVCVETRPEGQSEPPTPTAAARRKALTQYLDAIMTNGKQDWWTKRLTRKPISPPGTPLEHIFSHIKHIMWLETMAMEQDLSTTQWKTKEGREVRWMRESDMKEVGITSGVKKILKAVQSHPHESKGATKKRKR